MSVRSQIAPVLPVSGSNLRGWWDAWGSGATGSFNQLLNTIMTWDTTNKGNKYDYEAELAKFENQIATPVNTPLPPPPPAPVQAGMGTGTIVALVIGGVLALGGIILYATKGKQK